MISFLKCALMIAVKDLRSESRTRDILPQMLAFSLIVIVIFHFMLESGGAAINAQAPGILLISFLFSGMLGLVRSFANEREHEALKGLMLAPVGRSAIYLGKLLANFIFASILAAVSTLALGVFFDLDIPGVFFRLFAVTELAALGFVSVGTLYAAMTSSVRLREVLLPLLVFPILVPLLLSAVKLLQAALSAMAVPDALNWLNLIVAYDVVFFVIGLLTFEFVISD